MQAESTKCRIGQHETMQALWKFNALVTQIKLGINTMQDTETIKSTFI